MLRACALQYERSWNKSLLYTEFSYNYSYQESLEMTLSEMLYGRRCQTPFFWNKMGERKFFWTQHFVRCHETSSYGEREHVDCVVKTEELRRS
jgi:hypothetical protein